MEVTYNELMEIIIQKEIMLHRMGKELETAAAKIKELEKQIADNK